MKKVFFVTCFSLFALVSGFSQKSGDKKMVSDAVYQFASGADSRNTSTLDNVLDDHFRAVINQLFGSTEVSVIDKTTYLQMVKDEKIGGDKRSVNILSMDITQNNASVKAEFSSKAFHFQSYIFLVKDTKGNWKIVSDMPYIEKV